MMNFKIQAFFTTLMIGSMSALTISDAISQKVNAQVTPSCNNATIKGSYGSKFLGTVGTQQSGTQEVAAVGLIKFDGRGNIQGKGTVSSNGTIYKNRISSGTYTVNQDCTVQIVLTDNNTNTSFDSGIIVDGGKEIFFIETKPNVVFTGTLKKVN